MAGDTAREAYTGKVQNPRREALDLKEIGVARKLELRFLKKSILTDGDDIE